MTVAIIEAMCPGCQAILRFPPAWAEQPLRCKRCGLITAGNPAPPVPPRFPVAIAVPISPRAASGRTWPTVAFLGIWLLGMGGLASATYWAINTPPEFMWPGPLASVRQPSPALVENRQVQTAPPEPAAPPTPVEVPNNPPVMPESPPAVAPSKPSPVLSRDEQTILDLTNQARAKEKVPPLKPNAVLFEVARAHARNMARQGVLEHDLNGKRPHQRVQEAGYPFTATGENIAYSSELRVRQTFNGWMGSGGHRRNILNEEYQDIGIGVATAPNGDVYYAQVFGAQR